MVIVCYCSCCTTGTRIRLEPALVKRGPARLQQLLPPWKHPEHDVLSLPTLHDVQTAKGSWMVLWRSMLGSIDQEIDRLGNVEPDFGKCGQNTDMLTNPRICEL